MAATAAHLAVATALDLLAHEGALPDVEAALVTTGAEEDETARLLLTVGSDVLARSTAAGITFSYRELLDEHLPDVTFLGKENNKIRFVLLAIGATRGGIEADFDDELYWWRPGAFRHYSLCAAVALIRAHSAKTGAPLAETVASISIQAAPEAGA